MQKLEIEKVQNGWHIIEHGDAPPFSVWGCATLDEALSRIRYLAEAFLKPKRTDMETMLLEALDSIVNSKERFHPDPSRRAENTIEAMKAEARSAIAKAAQAKG